MVLIPPSFADTVKGSNYDDSLISINSDGSENRLFKSQPLRMLDYYDYQGLPVYVDFKTWDDSEKIYFESASFSYVFDKSTNTLETYDSGKLTGKTPKMKLHHTVNEAVNGTDIWNPILDNDSYSTEIIDTPKGIQIISSKGDFKTIYDLDYDYGFEYTYQYTNNNLLKFDHKYGFTSICDGIACDVLKIDNVLINNNELKYRNDITNKKITIGNSNFDLKDDTHNYTWAISKQQNKILIDFMNSKGRLNVGETLTVDPTFAYATGTMYRLDNTGTTGSSCLNPSYTESTGASTFIRNSPSGGSGVCILPATFWNVAGISDSLTSITSATVRYDVDSASNSWNCDFVSIDSVTSASSAQLKFEAVHNSATDYATGVTGCTSTGNQKTESLNANALSEFLTSIQGADDEIGVGMRFDPVSRDTTDRQTDFSDIQIEIVYVTTPPPDAVDDLTLVSTTQTTATISWTQPNLNGEAFINYVVNNTTPQVSPVTVTYANTTLTSITITGLTLGTDYSAQVSAYTAGGGNWTIPQSLVLNYTTSTFTVPDAPTLGALALSDTAIRYTSVAGASSGDNSTKDYSFRCSLNDSAWVTIVSNSSLPSNRIYEYSGLTLGDDNVCQWRDGSSAGWSDWSNNATAILQLLVVQTERTTNADPLKNFESMIDSYGGLFFGLSLFPFVVMVIGFMATPKTIGIFALITLFLMGIFHASGYFVYPNWYWFMMLLFAIPIIFTKNRS